MGAIEDPATPEFWEIRFRESRMPWDAGGVPRELQHYLASALHPRRVLIPGCGAAYEARAFLEAGYQVSAIDFSPAAVEAARQVLGPLHDVVCLGDFFAYDFPSPAFDVIYERAFLCSMPHYLWSRYAVRVTELLRPGGSLIGFFFFSDRDGGPPFGLKQGELSALLGDTFTLIANQPVEGSAPVFADRERWQEWQYSARTIP
jgi:SAM-dependent methyltransferase